MAANSRLSCPLFLRSLRYPFRLCRMNWRALYGLVTVALCACGQPPAKTSVESAQRAPLHLDAMACQPATAQQKSWVGREFADFERFLIACPVRTAADATVLYVVSLNAYDLEKSLPEGAPAPKLPKATLVLPDGKSAGVLPFAYPFDPPVTLDLTFTDWSTDLPHTVEMFLEDPGVGGNRKLPPLKWNGKLAKYTESTT